jgi:predicted PurR-regulated permease PerM
MHDVAPNEQSVRESQAAQAAQDAPAVQVRDIVMSRPLALTVIAVLAVLYSLYFARSFLIPIAFAVLLDFLLSPAVRALGRFRIPTPLGASAMVLGLIGLIVLSIYGLAGPVQTWTEKAPEALASAQREVRSILRPIERVITRTAEQVESAASSVSSAPKPPEVVVRGSTMSSRIFGSTQRFLAKLLEVVILLFFLLAGGDLFLQKVIRVLPHLHDKMKAVKIAREIESSVSTFLLTALAINVAEGAVVAVAMKVLGMPNPVLWGVMVTVFEFIPYLGAAAATVILGIAGLATFGTLGHALLVPGSFLLVNLFWANFVSPSLIGQRLALNPVAILIGLAFWFWIWGIPGAFIAVPLIATFKICCDHIDVLAPVGEFLGRRAERPDLPA